MSKLYSSHLWKLARARALSRDASRCTVARLLGGACSSGPLHVHHVVRPEDGGSTYGLSNLATVCAAHHPRWEAVRRALARGRPERRPACPHYHSTEEARRLCEARLARRRSAA